MDPQLRFYANKLAYEIDAWDLKCALDAGDKLLVIDTRSPEAYRKEHIPGAVNIPHRKMTEDAARALDRGSLIVTYCDGVGCNASTKGALNMAKLGFRVKELIGGLDWWKRDGHATQCASPGGAASLGACDC